MFEYNEDSVKKTDLKQLLKTFFNDNTLIVSLEIK